MLSPFRIGERSSMSADPFFSFVPPSPIPPQSSLGSYFSSLSLSPLPFSPSHFSLLSLIPFALAASHPPPPTQEERGGGPTETKKRKGSGERSMGIRPQMRFLVLEKRDHHSFKSTLF